jgi:phosphatidate phosphatase APP1
VTLTSSPLGILRSTFLDTPVPVEGMPELYARIVRAIGAPAPFFYLSASPYNLYPFLKAFRDEHYPHGTMLLREVSWMNLGGLLENLTLGVQEYKVGRMEKLYSRLPGRRMICIGDSTQSDPESYGDM